MAETVILLDGQTIQSLAMAKALKKNNYRVVLFCDTKMSYGYRTRYADEKVICPSVVAEPAAFKTFLLDYLQNNTIDVLIPMNDFSASFLSENKELLSRYTRFIIPDLDVFNSGYDKNRLMQVCEDNGFAHPKTADMEKNTVEAAAQKVGFPCLIKPNITTGGRGITLIRSKEELFEKYPGVRAEFGECHLQQFIPEGGKQIKVQLFIDETGTILNSTVIHKIRFYPEKGGSSCCNVTITEEKLVDLCSNVLKKIGWIGFADFDLIEDPRDGVVKIMEINPRVPACIKSSLVSGVDFATIIADRTLNKPVKQYQYKPGKYLRYFGLDLLWFLYSDNRFKTKPGWFRLLGSKIYYQEGSIDDLMPFLYGTVGGFLKQLNPQFRKKKAGMR